MRGEQLGVERTQKEALELMEDEDDGRTMRGHADGWTKEKEMRDLERQ